MAYSDIVLADSPIYYWRFEGNGNSTVGSANLTLPAGYTTNTSGHTFTGTALAFDGSTSTGPYAAAAAASDFFASTYTIEFWFKVPSKANSQELFRVGDDVACEVESTGKFLYYYRGQLVNPATTTYNNNTWRHCVITRDASRVTTVYMNGVSIGSFTAPTGGATDANFYIGGSQYSEQAIKGSIDEFAIYNTVLSSGRIAAHLAGPIDGGYTAQAATASATAPDAIGKGNVYKINFADYADGTTPLSPYTPSGGMLVDDGELYASIFNNPWTRRTANLPLAPINQGQVFVKVRTTSTAVGGLDIGGQTITHTGTGYRNIRARLLSDGTLEYKSWASGTTEPSTWTSKATGISNANVNLYASGPANTFVYFAYASMTNDSTVAPTPDVTVAADPGTALALAVHPGITASNSLNFPATPALITALAPSPVVSGSASYTATASTASADIVNPDVDVEYFPDVTFAAPAMIAAVSAPGGNFAVPVTVTAGAMTSSAVAVDPVISHENNVFYQATTAFAIATLIPAEEVNGAPIDLLGDPYYVRLLQQGAAASGSLWYRLDETSGTVADNTADWESTGASAFGDATYYGSPTFGQFGPEARRVVSFDGVDDYVQIPDNEGLVHGGVFEFVFRTEQANTVLVQGIDYVINLFFGQARGTLIGLTNGRLNVMPSSKGDFVGRTVLNDNQYHHIIVNFDWNGSGFGDYPGTLTVYVDGVLEMRRHLLQEQTFLAIPDTIGKGGGGFKGEFMEFVFQQAVTRSNTDAPRNYYAVWGIEPKYATPATATAELPNARGKGNQKRALGLYYNGNRTQEGITTSGLNYAWTGLWQNAFTDYTNQPYDFAGYKVFPQSVTGVKVPDTSLYLEGQFYDSVTGDLRYIDLMEDIDASEYDLVFFLDLPPLDNPAYGNSRILFENMVGSLREAIDTYNLSLWCPQPQLAIALGVIGQVEAHSFLREAKDSSIQGNARGLYDYRSAVLDEWQTANPSGLTLAERAYFYWDMHAANKYRVTAQVDGLTDLQGWIEEDFYFIQPRDPFNVSRYSMKYKELTSGLTIGQEIYPNQDFYRLYSTSSAPFYGGPKQNFVAVPPGQVKAGTILTKENLTHWVEQSEVANPYADYATTIVVSPGDNLNGRPVGGKIFVNFMEDASDLGITSLVYQIVPPNEEILDPIDHEGPGKRSWDYSGYRWSVGATSVAGQGKSLQIVQKLDAQGNPFSIFNYDNAPNLVSVNINEKYPIDEYRRYGLLERGFIWLADRIPTQPGSKTVRPAPLTATASMPQPTVSAQRDAGITVEPALASAAMARPLQDNQGGVTVTALPMTASAYMNGKAVNVSAEAMTATATMAENFDVVFAGGRQVFVYLPSQQATMYLKEDA